MIYLEIALGRMSISELYEYSSWVVMRDSLPF